MKKISRLAISFGVVLSVAVTAASAHEGATGVAKERMDLMESMSKDMKEILKRINANRDLAAIGPAATRIHATAPRIPSLFPEGSSTGITDAKPEIWRNWDDFRGKVQKLEDETDRLSRLAQSSDVTKINAQFRVVVHACTDCHSDYRRGKAERY